MRQFFLLLSLLFVSCAAPMNFGVGDRAPCKKRVKIEVPSFWVGNYQIIVSEKGVFLNEDGIIEEKASFLDTKYQDLHVYRYHLDEKSLLIFDFSAGKQVLTMILDKEGRKLFYCHNGKIIHDTCPIYKDLGLKKCFVTFKKYSPDIFRKKILEYSLSITDEAEKMLTNMHLCIVGNKLLTPTKSQVLNYGAYRKIKIFCHDNKLYCYRVRRRDNETSYRKITTKGISGITTRLEE